MFCSYTKTASLLDAFECLLFNRTLRSHHPAFLARLRTVYYLCGASVWDTERQFGIFVAGCFHFSSSLFNINLKFNAEMKMECRARVRRAFIFSNHEVNVNTIECIFG